MKKYNSRLLALVKKEEKTVLIIAVAPKPIAPSGTNTTS
jgi:hypothetical protein